VGYDIFDDGTTQVARNFTLSIGYGENTGNGDGTIDNAEVFDVVMANTASANVSGVTFTPASETLVISNIPYTALTTVSAENIGLFSVTMSGTDDATPTTSSTGLTITEVGGGGGEVETPVSASITIVAGGADGADTNGLTGTLNLGNL
ncbi:MAG: hypothetical protein OSB62_08730, partial [Alphaproteobacteria bacterium]|nr:hypothetical protein [Alphaproteobacteria bacterium]